MKKILAISFCFLLCSSVYAQKNRIDSLLAKIDRTEGIKKLYPFMQELLTIPQGDFALLKKGKQELAEARLSGYLQKQERALMMISTASFSLHDTPELLDASLQGIRISRALADYPLLGFFLHSAGLANVYQREPHKGIDYTRMAAVAHEKAGDFNAQLSDYSNIESSYVDLKMPDSAMFFANLEIALLKRVNKDHPDYWDASRMALGDLGEALASAGQADSALVYYRQAYLIIKNRAQKPADFPYLINNLAKTFLGLGKPDSAAKYGLESYSLASKTRVWDFTADAAALLAKIYEGRDDKRSVFYLKANIAANDSINAIDKAKQFRLIADRDRQHDDELKAEREKLYNRLRLYLVIGAAAVLLIIGIILWRNNQKQKHSNQLLSEQKEEIEAQRDNLETTLHQLKATQTQLVQSEKMASLGELTAGIAHEIQNPLNFVNNFSEVNQEMIDELELELKAGNIDEALAIAADIKQNEEKINQHGKRADSIVKGMLQHSRTNGGEKQLTDMNAVADEFFKLSYHGLRAKDKTFNASLITNFDDSLPKINVIPQDIGRVMLNLFNNAFYAVNQKTKTAGPDYKPTVEVTTFAPTSGGWGAIVKDNGTGIPDAIKGKIMQPFFTTKPTGEGTGLGLSLTYDMVVKGHGGKIDVLSKDGEYTEFIITLPL